jgi:hypothetical protein
MTRPGGLCTPLARFTTQILLAKKPVINAVYTGINGRASCEGQFHTIG